MRPCERFRTARSRRTATLRACLVWPGKRDSLATRLSALRDGTALPWHRVINAQGRLSLERVGSSSGLTQRVRLEREGVKVDAGGRVSLARFGWRLAEDDAERDRALLEHSEVAEQPPQQNENEDGAETAAAHFFRSVSRGEAAKQFAHRLR